MAFYPANDDELEQIGSINFDTRVEILYAYLVRGYNYKEVGGEILGIYGDHAGRLPNCVARCYGISGKKSGRYRNVPREVVEQFVDEYWPDEDGPCEDGAFDYFLRQYREAAAQQQRAQQQAQQQRAQRQRAEQEAQRAREAKAREEKAQEEKAKQDYARLVEQGKRALASNNIAAAYKAFRDARARIDTWELNLLLAETMAKAGNAAEHANDIIQELTEYEGEAGHTLTPDQCRYLAIAYLAVGNNSKACTYFFKGGDLYYETGDYANADKLYTEGREKSGFYETGHAFRVAYARSESKPRKKLTEEDDRFCISWYEVYRDKDGGWGDDTVYANLGYHHNRLKEYDQTVALLKPRAGGYPGNRILLGNLADACYHLEQWAEAIRWYERYEECGGDRCSYELGRAKAGMGRYEEALQDFLAYEDDDEEEAYKDLFLYIESNKNHYELADWRVEGLEARCGFENDEDTVLDWYNEAIEAGNGYAAEKMLDLVDDLKKLVAKQLLEQARDSLNFYNYDEARELAEKAKELAEASWEPDVEEAAEFVLAEAMARDNEDYYAGEIYERLSGKRLLNAEQSLWLAHACVAEGRLDEAAKAYAEVGDQWYVMNTREGYEKADEYYTECVDRTDRCTVPFRAAYSRDMARGESVTDEDRRYCARFYRQSAEETGDETAFANLSIHLNELGEYGQIRELLLPKARAGATNHALLYNLAVACEKLKDWAEEERWFQRYGELHGDRMYRSIGYAQVMQGKYAEAERSCLLELERTEDKKGILKSLAEIARVMGDAKKLADYRLRLMRLGCMEEGEAWLLASESAGAEEAAAEMLALLPAVRRRREEEERERLKAERRRREEEALLLLM